METSEIITFIAFILFLFWLALPDKPKKVLLNTRTPMVVQAPSENIIYQYAYWLKIIRNAASESEIKYFREQIKHYESTFIDHPDVMDYVNSLREELTKRSLALMSLKAKASSERARIK